MSPMGILGGTFDPIHYGHLRTALEILHALRFDQVRFIPCGDPPHRDKTHAAAELRKEMVEVAIAGQLKFVVDDRELLRDGPSYSVDTLAELRHEYPQRPLALIVGMDAFLGLPKWYRWREIMQLAHVVVARRPGWRAPGSGTLGELLAECGTDRVDDLHRARSGHIYVNDVTQLEISSTGIRELIAAGGDPTFLMPDAARSVIMRSNCYTTGDRGQVK